MARRTHKKHADAGFHAECSTVLDGLQHALRDLLDSSSQPIDRATDLQRALGVRVSLAWQVFRAARADDPLRSIEHIPLADAMAKFLEACEKRGFSRDLVRKAAAKYQDFASLVERHAGDRATFDAMTLGMGGHEATHIDLRARRAAFRAASQFWGVQSSLTYRCLIAGTTDDPSNQTSVIIQGSRGLRALSPSRSLPVCRRTTTWTRAGEKDELVASATGTLILEDFCSANLPRITTQMRGSVAHDYVKLVGVGLTAKIDVFFATKMHSVMDDSEPELGVTSMTRVPCEEFIADMLAPRGLLDPATATVRVCGCMEDVSAAETAQDEYLLGPPQPAMYMGTDLDALHDSVFPRCPELLRFVLRDIGQSRRAFDIFRCRVRFPMLHTCIALNALRKT